MKDVILFGASGFLGKELVKQADYLDWNFILPSSQEVDLCDSDGVSNYLAKNATKSTNIILLANRMPYTSSVKDDFIAMFDNIHMVKSILLALESYPVAEIIYTSSIDVYGYHDSLINEYSSVNPLTNYAASKLSCEMLLKVRLSQLSIPFANFRLPQIIGEGDPSNKVVNKFLDSIINGEPITVSGDGSSCRDFVSVNDVAKIINASLGKKIDTTLNLVSGNSISMLRLIENIKELQPKTKAVFEQSSNRETKFEFDNSKFKTYFPEFMFETRLGVLRRIYNHKREKL
jgi:nucleoside-diphosphate-sugar epimerase